MAKKYALQKGTAILGTGLIIFGMGSCAKKIETPIITPSPKTTQEYQLTAKDDEKISLNNTTTITIFDNLDEIETLEETIIPTIIETTIPHTTKKEDGYYFKFTNQQQLETYLEKIYNDSGKDYWTIINEAEENDDYYANRSDLSMAAAYMLLKENGLYLDDVALELDYLLCLVNNPREEFDEDRQALEILYEITGGRKVYPIFERLALERHLIMCPNKNNHKIEAGRIICIELDEQKILLLIIEKNKDKEIEVGPLLVKKIKQLIEKYS